MIGWIQYLIYIMSFFIPPVGLVTFWVFSGRDEELRTIGKWSALAAFVGLALWAILCAVGFATRHCCWSGMGRWR